MSPGARDSALAHLGDREPASDGLLARVGREIEAEVRELRRRGVFPPSYERRLHDLFAQVVPTGVLEHETEEALSYLEGVSHVDIEVPLGSRMPGGTTFKRLLRPLMAWYLNYVAAQVNRFMGSSVRMVRLLAERVSAIEEAAPSRRSLALAPTERGTGVDLAYWAPLVRKCLAGAAEPAGAAGPGGAPGVRGAGRPVLHAECGTGGLVSRMLADGLDAYGVDPCADLLDEPAQAPAGVAGVGLDLRWAEPLDHLWGLDDASLGGLVLSGCVDRLEVGAQRELAATAAAKVGFGGVVVVIGTTPGAWLARRLGLEGVPESGVVEADLAPGRPLHPQTWAWLLASEGLVGVEVFHGPPQADGAAPGASDAGVPATAGPEPALARLAEMIAGPTSFAVVATRPTARTPAGP